MEERIDAVVALGMFDGMHLGHRALIARTVDHAKKLDASPVVFTFSNHPAEVLGGRVRLLSTPQERTQIMKDLGIADVRMLAFTREFAALSPEKFVERMCDLWRVRAFVVGFNYSFGDHGRGTPQMLAEMGKAYGFTVDIIPPVMDDGEAVSSTRIRNALENGDVQLASRMLARPYQLTGKVIANRRIGRKIGFPTANITVDAHRVLPKPGVYMTNAVTEDGKVYRGVTNIGTNPTVGGKKTSVETHLLGFDGDLYGEVLQILFLERIRGEIRFDSLDELKRQIDSDAKWAAAR